MGKGRWTKHPFIRRQAWWQEQAFPRLPSAHSLPQILIHPDAPTPVPFPASQSREPARGWNRAAPPGRCYR